MIISAGLMIDTSQQLGGKVRNKVSYSPLTLPLAESGLGDSVGRIPGETFLRTVRYR